MFGRKKRQLSDFNSEIQSHLNLAAGQFRDEGLDEREARYAALRQFGNVTIAQERFYESRRWRWLDALGAEFHHALKRLVKTPRFTLPAILTLALGLGGAMTFYSAFHSVFLRSLPFPGADRIYRITANTTSGPIPWIPVDFALELMKLSPDVERVGFLTAMIPTYWMLDNGNSISVQSLSFDAGIQDMAGLKPSLGSLFGNDSFATGNGVIVSHRFWKSKLGSDPAIIGRMLNINNKRQPVLGVLGDDSELPLNPEADIYAPIKTPTTEPTLITLVRLRKGVEPAVTLSRFSVIARNRQEFQSGYSRSLDLQSLRKAMAKDADLRFFVVCGAAALFLLLATANVAGLFLARAAERTWETSMSLCLGAPKSSLFRKFLVEGLVVSVVSAGFGFWINAALAGSLRAWLPGGEALPGLNGVWDHLGVSIFGLALVVLITLCLGLTPTLQIRRLDLALALQEERRTQSARSKGRTALVVAQLALATVMLCATALLGQSLWTMAHKPVPFETEKLVMARLLYEKPYNAGKGWQSTTLLPTLRARPQIQGAAYTTGFEGFVGMMLVSGPFDRIGATGRSVPRIPTHRVWLSEDAFETLGISLIKGRGFKAEDRQKDVCILNREAERLAGLPSGKAVGQKLYAGRMQMEIIGVAPDFDLFMQGTDALPVIFHPFAGFPPPDALFVRSTLSKKDLEATIKSVVRETFPVAKTGGFSFLSEIRGEKSLPHRQIIAMLSVFGGAAILLASLGLSALLSDSVSRRRRELGIRASLGATSRQLIRQVMLQGLWRTGLGVALGVAAALASGRYLQSLLFGIRPNDPPTLMTVASLLLFIGLISSLVPAIRAASIDPAKTLREE